MLFKSESDAGSLRVPTDELFQLVLPTSEMAQSPGPSALLGCSVLQKLLTCVQSTREHMLRIFLRMQLHKMCEKVTALPKVGVNRQNRKLYLKVCSRVQ